MTSTIRRIGLIAVLAIGCTAKGTGPQSDITALAEYHRHYSRFFRDHYGCPDKALRFEECAGEAAGFFNGKDFTRSRELAKRLYGLRD